MRHRYKDRVAGLGQRIKKIVEEEDTAIVKEEPVEEEPVDTAIVRKHRKRVRPLPDEHGVIRLTRTIRVKKARTEVKEEVKEDGGEKHGVNVNPHF